MRVARRARTRNGLPWRTGVVILATLNMARHARQGPSAGTYTDLTLWSCARRLRDPRFGGGDWPKTDPSFRVAARVVWGRPSVRWMS